MKKRSSRVAAKSKPAHKPAIKPGGKKAPARRPELKWHVLGPVTRQRLARALTKQAPREERGYGEGHSKAYLTNHDVDLMRALAESGMYIRDIATKFEIPWSTARDIVSYRTRCR